ncbi:precorrin-4 C11-methyltransferase [Desulfarculus baarsii DSM 2075]|uniref:Precorrin-4 C11-methyltransferase n=1 Tax=Desulfarculus baarsii (strain ATCC 33931 / DSM 2075 / LMG 7858 / VKM B-1802 / 2st14) TaxID=644282 RepID=E1QJS9_DESB2|nr:precorrin-4 C(11)-methyltransferase [Desulfarculus baarsii]ADK85822.1 precorrin-4 C11-methyltransferase [Desulfarculus baarsii DSM 2075]
MSQARESNPIIFVGAGPGDPELITVAGRKALEQADLVVYAGSLVSPEMLDWCQPQCRLVNSAHLDLDQIVGEMIAAHDQGQRVVRLQTGDVSLYGALPEQLCRLAAHGASWRIIPGVSAAFASAAAIGLSYTLPETCQSLIFTRAGGRTPMPARENLAAMAGHGCSVVIYLSAALGQDVAEALSAAYGPESPVAVVQRASWPDEKAIWSTAASLQGDLERAGINRQALIICGPAVAALRAGYADCLPSRLYDHAFGHAWRPAGQKD